MPMTRRPVAKLERKKMLAVFGALTAMVGSLYAQMPGPDGPPGGPDGPMADQGSTVQRILREPSAARLLGQLTKDLKLSAEQKAKIKSVLDQRQHRVEAVIKSSAPVAAWLAKSESVDRESWAEIRLVLIDTQQTRFDAFTKKLAEKRERALHRAESDDEFPPPPPGGPPPGPF